MRIIERLSPNRSARVHGDDAVRLVVVHTPEGSYEGTVRYILTSAAKVSYHLLLKKDGTEATQFVPFSQKAWHAGAVNSLSDGISVEGHARLFDLKDPVIPELVKVVARRLYVRGLPAQWTTDLAKGGFCRHGDLQSDRSDPTPDLAEWRLFVGMVQDEYSNLKMNPDEPWPLPIPQWFWKWMIWKNTGAPASQRPSDAPAVIPVWAWRRRIAWLRLHKV